MVRAPARRPGRAAANAARKPSTSSAVEPLPSETRITLRASAAVIPWAVSDVARLLVLRLRRPSRPATRTRPGRAPARAARRAGRRRSSSEWPGSRSASAETTVTPLRHAGLEPVAQHPPRVVGPRAPRPARRRSRRPRRTFSVPERRPASWPPPQISGGSRPGSRASRHPTPFGPVQLVRRERPSCRRRRRRIERQATARPGRRRRAAARPRRHRSPRPRGSAGSTPVTLFAHMTAASRSPGRTSARNAATSSTPRGSTGAQADLEAPPLQLAARARARRGARPR